MFNINKFLCEFKKKHSPKNIGKVIIAYALCLILLIVSSEGVFEVNAKEQDLDNELKEKSVLEMVDDDLSIDQEEKTKFNLDGHNETKDMEDAYWEINKGQSLNMFTKTLATIEDGYASMEREEAFQEEWSNIVEAEKIRVAEEEARIKAEEEAARIKAEEEARIKAEEEARIKAEEEARIKAEEEAARKKAEEEARIKAAAEAKRKAAAEAKRKAAEAARIKAEKAAQAKKSSSEVKAATTSGHGNYSAAEVEMLAKIVHAEASGEDTKGKILVANVILNRVRNGSFPGSIKGVIYQKNGGVYQFTPIRNGAYNRARPSSHTIDAVQRAMSGEDYSQGALYFASLRATASSSSWFNRSKTKLFGHGGHNFYK